MIGYFGPIHFESSTKKVKTFKDLSRKNATRWGEHSSLQRKPVMEFVGKGIDEISFTLFWRIEDNVYPEKEIKPLKDAMQEGKVLAFFLGSRPVGSGKYVVTQIDDSAKRIDNKGNLLAVEYQVTAKEYVTNKAKVKEKKKDKIDKKMVAKKKVTKEVNKK